MTARSIRTTVRPARVGVIDVGSNTVRLLVADRRSAGPDDVGGAKAYVGLGAEIVRTGGIGPEKLAVAAREVRRFAGVARALGSGAAIDVLVTAPGRQAANADELVAALSRASGLPVRVLTREEEGVLAYEGALGSARIERWPAAVCDVGGGSTEITVGDLARGPFWSRSADVGSLRLTASTLRGDPPTAGQLAEAAALVASELEPVRPPATGTALVVGGAARALARLEGRRLDVAALGRALDLVATRPAADVARSTGLDPQRAATLAGGTVILLELARRLGPLHVGDGGLREGAVARLLAECEAA